MKVNNRKTLKNGQNIRVFCAFAKMVPAGDLVRHPKNPNRHPTGQVELLAKIIKEQGWRAPIVVSKRSGFIVAGHGRLEAALLLRCESVPVDFQEFESDAKELAHVIADNRIAELAEIDDEVLKSLIEGLKGDGFDLDLTGFNVSGLESLFADGSAAVKDAEPKIDQAEELQKKWGTAKGQLWQLGDHRLICGDSISAGILDRFKFDVCLTDPPYGLGKKMQGGTWAKKSSQYNAMHKWDAEAKQGFFDLISGLHIPSIVWGGHNFIVPPSRCWLVWEKPKFPTMADMELAWTNFDRPSKSFPSSRSPDGEKSHPTQKPVDLFLWCLSFFEHSAKSILDPFCGSGTTLIACENLGRKCLGIELEPGYVAVILQRFQDATSKVPVLIS